MGSKNKLKRFRENETFSNVIQPSREEIVKGNFEWKAKWKEYFGNTNPVVIELGCGKGEYTVGLARKYPQKNFIGIDIKGARFWKGAKTALEDGLPNVVFIRTQIELIDRIFGSGEIAEIWITFPDPQIKYKRTKHRLINLSFLEKYKLILESGGAVNLKTDSEFLHGYALGLLHGMGKTVLYANHNIYKNEGASEDALQIQTYYENQFLNEGKAITYLKFLP